MISWANFTIHVCKLYIKQFVFKHMHSHFQLHCAHILRVMKAFNEKCGKCRDSCMHGHASCFLKI